MFDLRAHGLSAAIAAVFLAFLAILSGLLLLVASFSVEVVTLAAFSAVTSSTVTITFARFAHPPLVVMVGVVIAVALIAGGVTLLFTTDPKLVSTISGFGLFGAVVAATRQGAFGQKKEEVHS